MQLTMKPYATAGVALVGASVIAVSAVAPQPQLPALPDAQTRAVEVVLRDLANPFAALGQVLQTTVDNVDQLGTSILSNPAPLLTGVLTGTGYTALDTLGLLNTNLQIVLNGGLGTVVSGALSHTGAALGVLGSSAAQAIPGALASTVQLLNTLGALGAGTVGALLTNTPADLGQALQYVRQGDLGDALQSVAGALLLDPLLGTNFNNPTLLANLFNLAAGPLNTVANVLQAGGLNALAAPFSTVANLLQSGGPSIVSTAVLGAYGVVANLAYAVGDGVQKIANGLASLNLGKIYNGVVNGLAEMGTAVSNALLSPTTGVGLPGLLLGIRNALASWLPTTSPYKSTAAVSAAKNSVAAIPSTTSSGVSVTPTAATITPAKSSTSTKSSTATPDSSTGDTDKPDTTKSGTAAGTDKSDTTKAGTGAADTTNSGTDKSGAIKTSTGAGDTTNSGSDKSATGAGSDTSGTKAGAGTSDATNSGTKKAHTGKSSTGKSSTGKSRSAHRGHGGGHGGK